MGSPSEPAGPEDNPWVELLRKALAGDKAAEDELFEQIRPFLKVQAAKLDAAQGLRHDDVSDIAQNSSLAAWERRGDFRGTTDGQFRAWLLKIAKNELRNGLRHERQQKRDVRRDVPLPEGSSGGSLLAADTPTPSSQATRHEEEARREQALHRLSADDQQVLQLRFRQDRPWAEVAQLMGRSEPAVMQLYHRARKRWKSACGDEP